MKSSGCEKRIVHLSPMKLWKLMGPLEVSASKLGASEPRRRLTDSQYSSIEFGSILNSRGSTVSHFDQIEKIERRRKLSREEDRFK